MNNKTAEQLLNDLVNGLITPAEFKRRATAPRVVMCMVCHPSGPGGEVGPEDLASLVIDERKTELPFSEYLAIRERYPDAVFVTPIVFSP